MSQINPSIYRAYDIRGIYPVDINEEVVYKTIQAYVKFVAPKSVVLGRDVRTSGEVLVKAARQAFVDAGVDVVDIGVCSTDMMYFAVANYGYDGGVTITASHNPREYNGMKLVRQKGIPISGDSGIMDIKEIALSGFEVKSEKPGTVREQSILDDYCMKVLSFLKRPITKNYKIVAAANFGMAGIVLRRMIELGNLPLEVTEIDCEPNGEFPKGRPDPLIPERRVETIETIKRIGADFGVAWDADADRTFFYDESGTAIEGYYLTTIMSKYFLDIDPKNVIIADNRLVMAIQQVVDEHGARLVLNKAGHSFIKETMRKEDAVFAGETSGHFYFRDYFYTDCGMVPLMIMLQLMEDHDKFSDIFAYYTSHYFISGEINSEVKDPANVMQAIKEKYLALGGEFDPTDGVGMEMGNWRFNLRPSNNEPLIRLNVESTDQALLKEKTQELLTEINSN